MKAPEAQKLIDAVQQSPILVAKKDKAAWCSLYAVDGQVNDPVGSRPHEGRAAIERFWDTFIAPNGIVFKVESDRVCGMSVMRDLVIETTMSTGIKLNVPMHLRYDLVEENGALRIRRLYAHWELMFMILQLLATGPRGWWTACKLGPQLIANQGLGGVLGFMRGFLGVGAAGKRAAVRLFQALRASDSATLQAELAPDAVVEWPAGTPIPLAQVAGNAKSLEWRKVMASGRCVTATVEAGGKRGVALLEFGSDNRISALKVYA